MKKSNDVSRKEMSADQIRHSVRESYAKVAEGKASGSGCCEPNSNSSSGESCCGPGEDFDVQAVYSARLGYTEDDLKNAPQGADMGLGCGNPRAIAALKPGEVVLDLGSGGGFDCFLAAREIGPTGRVIGVDMTPAMISRARENAYQVGAENVEFRLGEIEHLPIADESVDVIISNCVINLSPDNRDFIKDWAPGRKIEDYIVSAYIEAEKPDDSCCGSGCC